jgi:hypothetical protein
LIYNYIWRCQSSQLSDATTVLLGAKKITAPDAENGWETTKLLLLFVPVVRLEIKRIIAVYAKSGWAIQNHLPTSAMIAVSVPRRTSALCAEVDCCVCKLNIQIIYLCNYMISYQLN